LEGRVGQKSLTEISLPEGGDAALWLAGRSAQFVGELEGRVDEARTELQGDGYDGENPLFAQLAASGRPKNQESTYDVTAYVSISDHLRVERSDRIGSLKLPENNILSYDNGDLPSIAERLSFSDVESPKVSIVIPVYNNIKFTIECLASVEMAGGIRQCEIIVIDDGSTDQTSELIKNIKGVRYLRNEENLGFLKTCNRAAVEARGEYLIFLNNDTQVRPGWMAPLVICLEDDESVGAAAPKLLFPNGRLQEAGCTVDPEGSAELIGVFDDPNAPRYNYPRVVDYASGACLAVRRSDFETLNGFDLIFQPAYCEDADLCFRLRALGKRIMYVPDSVVVHHLSVSSDSMAPTYKTRLAVRNQQRLVERWGEQLERDNKIKVVSFYLPQFHRIAENDRWWGAGFTEWTNVSRALPNYLGHYQPHRPAELGYYDIEDPQPMERQADLARKYGVYGFCYYYYWFSGRRIMDLPLQRLLKSGKPSLPFALCWANENWTRTWDGQEKDVLLAQRHLPEDGERFIKDIAPWLRMDNYIRINGKPLLVIYRPGLVPEIERTVEVWRTYARENGIGDLYLAFVETFENARTFNNPTKFGFDASIEFPPAGMAAPMQSPGIMLNPSFGGLVNDYHEVVRSYLREPVPGYTRFRGVMPSWDNTARRQDMSYNYHNASPGAFQAWLEAVFQETRRQNYGDERMVFVNAWNEWAEGAHLEPDVRFGHGWLEAVRNAHDAGRIKKR
jgi:GT2 family glycosyltransferase